MIVQSYLAYWAEIVPTSSTTSRANVPMGLVERDAKRRLTCVATQIVSMETVWINSTDTSMFLFFLGFSYALFATFAYYFLIHGFCN